MAFGHSIVIISIRVLPSEPDTLVSSDRLLPLLLILFAASGAAGLIYEIVWLQLLQLVVGSSAVSLAVLLGTYMGGLCLGSILFARIAPLNRAGRPTPCASTRCSNWARLSSGS